MYSGPHLSSISVCLCQPAACLPLDAIRTTGHASRRATRSEALSSIRLSSVVHVWPLQLPKTVSTLASADRVSPLTTGANATPPPHNPIVHPTPLHFLLPAWMAVCTCQVMQEVPVGFYTSMPRSPSPPPPPPLWFHLTNRNSISRELICQTQGHYCACTLHCRIFAGTLNTLSPSLSLSLSVRSLKLHRPRDANRLMYMWSWRFSACSLARFLGSLVAY